jgi:integrase
VWLHKFRSTFCTGALWSGISLPKVQKWMGHKDVASAMRYWKSERGAAVRQKVEAIWA